MHARLEAIRRMALHRSGALGLLRHLNRSGARILTYHRFARVPAGEDPKALLEAQCAHIRECYHPVAMSELGRRVRSGTPLAPRSVAVTVDDGYRDFFDVAYPVFSAWRIPVTVFLVTDFLDRKTWLWVDQVEYAFRTAEAARVELECPTGEVKCFPLESAEQRRRAADVLKFKLKKAPNGERLELLAALPRLLKTAVPEQPPDEDAPLSWDDVRAMAGNGIEFGAHTKAHPILSRLRSKAELREEIEGSKARIEEETGLPVLHFCYPNGGLDDFEAGAVEIVERARFLTAVTMQGGLNYAGANPFLLKRIGVEVALPMFLVREYMAGFNLRVT